MRYLLLLMALLGVNVTAWGQPSTPDLGQVQQLISATGLDKHIQQIPAVLSKTASAGGAPTSAFVSPLMKTMATVFNPDEMLDTLAKDLTRRLDVPTLLDAMQWYRSDNARALIGAHKHATQPQTIQKMGEVLATQQSQASPQRLALLQHMSASTQANDIALDMMVNVQAAFMTGLGTMIAPNQTQSFKQVHDSFAATRNLMADKISEQLLLQQTVALETVSDDTIHEFLQFADSPSGKKLFTALRASLDYTVQTTAERIPAVMKANNAKASQ
ncbi:hypothetical protein [Ketobacter sp.]|uniref:hypothetical protein n=1 Tax=Ketobacter sp. TaxID=2083498 RepID=UPI000F2A2C94|nr:hypothetical protein [Ketobacter sp.]RLU01344.1 MAG: hypothetical protein D9N14_03140 [Ketobacter sp.]